MEVVERARDFNSNGEGSGSSSVSLSETTGQRRAESGERAIATSMGGVGGIVVSEIVVGWCSGNMGASSCGDGDGDGDVMATAMQSRQRRCPAPRFLAMEEVTKAELRQLRQLPKSAFATRRRRSRCRSGRDDLLAPAAGMRKTDD